MRTVLVCPRVARTEIAVPVTVNSTTHQYSIEENVSMRSLATRIVALLATGFAAGATAGLAQPVPEFLGVYAVTGGRLVELKPLAGSGLRDMELMGGDLLKGSSNIAIDDPKVYFVIYREGASSVTSMFLEELKQVRYTTPDEFSRGGLQPVEDLWVGTKRGFNLKIAPLKENPQMMVRAVWPEAIPPGRYGLNIGGALFDLQIGAATDSCVVRQASFAAGGAVYTECSEFFAKHPGVRRPPGSSATPTQDTATPEPVAGRGDGTVVDPVSQMMWTQQDNGSRVDWEEARTYCDSLELGGFSDWRLPSLAEVREVYVPAPGGSSPSNFGSTRLGLAFSSCCFWTSSRDDEGRNQFFSLASGQPRRLMIKFVDLRLMRAVCVRSGE
jgi:hypothetical protein